MRSQGAACAFGLYANHTWADASAAALPAPHTPTLPGPGRKDSGTWAALRRLVFFARMGARLVELTFIFSPCLVLGLVAIPYEGLRRTFWDLMRRGCRWAGATIGLSIALPFWLSTVTLCDGVGPPCLPLRCGRRHIHQARAVGIHAARLFPA